MQQLTRDIIISAIKRIEQNPSLIIGRQSNTYDLLFEYKTYPPILILSEANKLVGGTELTLKDFGNSTEKAFKILGDLGFKIVEKKNNNEVTFKQWLKTTSPSTSNKPSAYMKALKWLSKKYLEKSRINEPSIFNITDPELINELYKESIDIQKDVNSYIFDTNAPSYGLQGFYSASLKEYLRFLQQASIPTPSIASWSYQFEINAFIADLEKSSFKFNPTIVTRFVASLIAKPFVLLSGLSGSGKTKIAQTFAKWICAANTQYEIVPVGADWVNREPLLGYPDGLNPKNYVLPDNGALQLILHAQENQALPHFLILDEMNLSHVERYFADFLSIMESNEAIKLYAGEKRSSGEIIIPHSISWPTNLYIIGTVNIDETTYMFSPKVLDRANVIEFRLKSQDIAHFLTNVNNSIELIVGKGTNMAADFVGLSGHKDTFPNNYINDVLLNFFERLQVIGAEFGFRTTVEIIRLYATLRHCSNDTLSKDECIDIAVMQKLLPKIHGSRSKVTQVLESLMELCLNEDLLPAKLLDVKYIPLAKYPISFEKLRRMYKNALDNGFTSYAEA